MNELKVPNYDIDACAKSYMKDLKNFKPLNKDDEHSLIKAYKKNHDLDARNKLITSNLKYTCKIANKFRNRGVPFSYLISEANDALMYAIDMFDENKDVKIMSYAIWWVSQRLHKLTEKNVEQLENDLPTDRESQQLNDNVDYSQEYGPEYEYHNTYFIRNDTQQEINERNELIDNLCSGLNEREIDIVSMKFGLPPYESEHTLEEIGKKMNLTKERVRQIHEKAMTKMRSQAMMTDCKFLTK